MKWISCVCAWRVQRTQRLEHSGNTMMVEEDLGRFVFSDVAERLNVGNELLPFGFDSL